MATGYSVANGQIITPAGTPFIARGVDVYDMQMDYAGQILTLFPHINFVRLACTNAGSGNYSANAAADLEPFITTMTGAGVVVEIENHNDQQTVLTGSALAAESAWYASLAAAFIGNPLVWFGTMNEPMDTGTDGGAVVSAQHVATYEAIRGTGNETIIMLMLIAGYGPVFNGTLTSSVYETMTNVVWDQHFYNWITQDSTDSATIAAALASFIKADQALTSANGIMPVIIGEYGPSTNGSTEDAGGMTLVSVVQQSGYGCAAWDMCYPGQTNADDLVVQSTPLTLTAYGTAVAGFIAAGAAVTPTPTPTPTPAPTPTPTPTSTPTKVVAPLTGTVTAGTWQTLQMALAGGPSGQPMQYNLLMPAQYNPDILYPLFVFGHPLDNGMNGSSYPKPGSQFVTDQAYGPGLSLDSVFNDPAWRTEFPCIVIAPQCDETIDPSGANPNSNFGGYADSQNSGWNEQAVNLIVQHALATLPVDPTRCYGYGTSLGAIGVLAWLVDNNQINGPGLKLWTAGVGLSDQLYRPTVPNDATLFARMADVPYLAVSTPSDNVPSSYDQPAWQYYTSNSNYPTQADYDAGGVAAIRAGTSQFYYIAEPSGSPWNTLLALNANGGDGTAIYQWLFAQTASGAVTVPTPTPTPAPTPTPTPTAPAPAFVTAGTTESFTDSGGAVWTLSAAGVALKNGAAVAGGGGTSMLAYESGVIYGQDAQTGDWFEYANGGWTPATLPVAPPAAPPPPLGSVTPASVQAEIDAVTALLATIRANVGTL